MSKANDSKSRAHFTSGKNVLFERKQHAEEERFEPRLLLQLAGSHATFYA